MIVGTTDCSETIQLAGRPDLGVAAPRSSRRPVDDHGTDAHRRRERLLTGGRSRHRCAPAPGRRRHRQRWYRRLWRRWSPPCTGIVGAGVTGDGVSIGGRSAVGDGQVDRLVLGQHDVAVRGDDATSREGASSRSTDVTTGSSFLVENLRLSGERDRLDALDRRRTRSHLAGRASQPVRGRSPGQASRRWAALDQSIQPAATRRA